MRLALIGYGAIGQAIVARLRELGEIDRLDGILARSRPEADPGRAGVVRGPKRCSPSSPTS